MWLNWRKPVVFFLFGIQGSPVAKELSFIRSIERKPRKEILEIQNRRLAALLLHAWENTDYYRDVLAACGVVRSGKVNLDRFDCVPILTKDIIRRESTRLRAKTLPRGRRAYPNRTGGSTGQPVEFWQDSYYDTVNIATKLYHFEMLGKDVGEPEMKIWGSERDLFEGTIGWQAKLKNFVYNRRFENCFHLPEHRIRSIITHINNYKPKIIWCYRDGMYLIADYINRHGLSVHSPAAIFCAGGTLYPYIEETIERAFKSPVINFYGSREMGDVACQCRNKMGLHISSHSHVVEVVNKQGQAVIEEDGDLAITSLANYAMPLIRYQIGDRGRLTSRECPCGRGFPLIETVSGRVMEVFINERGEYVDPSYFIHLIGVVYNSGFVKKFQVIQEDYRRVRVKMVLDSDIAPSGIRKELDEIASRIRLVMGDECTVFYDFVSDIPLTKSGKYLYMIREIPDAGRALPRAVEVTTDRQLGR